MNISLQLCSLDLAKRLKELGILQESLFYRFGFTDHQYLFCKYYEEYSPNVDLDIKNGFSAFTISELNEIIFHINNQNLEKMGYLNITVEMIDRHEGFFYRITNNLTDHIIDEIKEVDAYAKLLIIFLENNLMELSNDSRGSV